MRNLSVLPRRPVLLVLLLAGALVALAAALASSAGAIPGDPPIQPQSPGNGASVPASGEALKVTFSCPSYINELGEEIEPEEEEEEGEEGGEEEGVIAPIFGPPVIGGPENYAVHFSTSSTVNANGQIGTAPFGEAGEGGSEGIKPANSSCVSEFELPTKPYPAALYEGRIYWQAYRECESCVGGIEVGPISSFVVVPTVEEPELTFREQVFAGYLTKIGFGYAAELGGAVVELQEWTGSAWRTVGVAPGSNEEENSFFTKLKAGRHLFRPVVLGGGPPLVLAGESKVVRKPGKKRVTNAGDDGAYLASNAKEREEWPITFSVSKNGTTLRNLHLEAETTCKGPTKAQDVKIEVPAHLRNAKIAPDGTVFGVTKTTGPEAWTVTLTGSLFDGRFQGELSTSYANCTGFRLIDATRKSSLKG